MKWRKYSPLALSARPGLLELYGASGPSASLIRGWAGYSSKYRQVEPVSTLDNILEGRFTGEQLLLKIDVEGAEFEVLKGAIATMTRETKARWLLGICLQEFHPEFFSPDFRQVFRIFLETDYEAYAVTDILKPVTAADVDCWCDEKGTDHAKFNYLFASPTNFRIG